ncbi:PH domain-containing protein [Halalkalicoccus jeotgali]|uniref:Low molecular weight protein antigen 6 PH domain-containing protein n=1 Tax=Halalkalicoccus jeotgali (strain DSM 18796 / CECT 7217 / JCM 14584 / KCTC 4019 / B3) TaxID=795797 RepID=D8JA14_HALJB|nr:PH domain-containing protein [Halalkalicoccus jeotgali]ADJ14536.1 hypothetical protein HacjB3_05725 [Halalkalicoccus jeotgali B3]ELY40108.1 hypothetical protein C497_04090 [Halalkalicoccus jeotgali B3]
MSHRHDPTLPVEAFETPDAGFMAAAGAFLAAVLVAAVLTVAAAVGASVASVLGGVSTAATVGVIAGGVASSFVAGLPERIGRRSQRLVLPFVPAVVLVGIAAIALAVPAIPALVALGAGIGAGLTLLGAFAIATMSRTRYARAMTPDEPTASVLWLKPNQDRRWFALGALWIAGYAALIVATGEFSAGNTILHVLVWGVFALYRGLELRLRLGKTGRDGRLARIFDPDRLLDLTDRWLPELRVHEAGLAVVRPMQRRFVPWTTVADVRLTAEELVIERPRRFDLRCDRTTIDDAERLFDRIESARTNREIADALTIRNA